MPKGKPAVSHAAIRDWVMAVIRASSRKDIRPSCAIVAAALAVGFMNRETGLCCPKYETIASETGLPRSTVVEAVHQLAEAGFLSRRRLGRNGPNSYQFTNDGSTVDRTCKPRRVTVNSAARFVPPPEAPSAGASHLFDPSLREGSHTAATVSTSAPEQDFAIAIERRSKA